MRYSLFTLLLSFSVMAYAQSNEKGVTKTPAVDVSLGSNMFFFEATNELPTYRAACSIGLELSHPRGTLTPRLGLVSDATRTSSNNGSKILKHFLTVSISAEYDYAMSARWFIGADVLLGTTRMHNWSLVEAAPQTSMIKPGGFTLESELDDMEGCKVTSVGLQAIVGFILTDKFKLRLAATYSKSIFNGNNSWFYCDFLRESTMGICLSVQYLFR